MTWTRRIALLAATLAIAVLGTATTAHASTDIGWIYSEGGQARGSFDADVAGHAGWEKVTVCDISSDGKSAIALLHRGTPSDPQGVAADIIDTVNNGSCATTSGNFAAEETSVFLVVCDRDGSGYFDCVRSFTARA